MGGGDGAGGETPITAMKGDVCNNVCDKSYINDSLRLIVSMLILELHHLIIRITKGFQKPYTKQKQNITSHVSQNNRYWVYTFEE